MSQLDRGGPDWKQFFHRKPLVPRELHELASHINNRPIDHEEDFVDFYSLCVQPHHLWILHILHGLKIEGTAPDSLTFTFGPNSSPEGQSFMIYSNGRKAFSP